MTAEQHRLVTLALERIAETPAANVLGARPGVVVAVTLTHERKSVAFRRVGHTVRGELWASWGSKGHGQPVYFPLAPELVQRAARLIDRPIPCHPAPAAVQ